MSHEVGAGDSTTEADTGQNRLSAGQCQAVTGKRPSGDIRKSPKIISWTTSRRSVQR